MERPPRILVIDDDDSTREVVEEFLSTEGFEVWAAANGRTALQLVEQAPPDVILLDMLMPIMDGPHFTATYRQRPGPHAPIIVLTATFDAASSARSIEADAYLDKPFMLEELLDVVRRSLDAGEPEGASR